MLLKFKQINSSAILFSCCMTLATSASAQVRSDNFNVTLFQTGRIKQYKTEVNDTLVHTYNDYQKMRAPNLELYLTNDLYYVNAAAYSIFLPALLDAPTFFGPGIEFGWGWQVNRNSPIKIGKKANILFGLGFNTGVHFLRAKGDASNPKITKNSVYVGPTIGLNIQVGQRFNLQNVLELTYGREKTQRIEWRSNFNYRISERLGVVIVPCAEGIFYSKDATIKGKPAETEYGIKLRYTQIGFLFTID